LTIESLPYYAAGYHQDSKFRSLTNCDAIPTWLLRLPDRALLKVFLNFTPDYVVNSYSEIEGKPYKTLDKDLTIDSPPYYAAGNHRDSNFKSLTYCDALPTGLLRLPNMLYTYRFYFNSFNEIIKIWSNRFAHLHKLSHLCQRQITWSFAQWLFANIFQIWPNLAISITQFFLKRLCISYKLAS
jgi:hypothetical protein